MLHRLIANKHERIAYQQELSDLIQSEIAANNQLSAETERNLLTYCSALIKNDLREEIPFFRAILATLPPQALEHFLELQIADRSSGNIVMLAAVNHHLFLRELVDLYTPKIPIRSGITPVLPFEAYLRLLSKTYHNNRTILHEVIELASDSKYQHDSQKEFSNPAFNLRLIIAPLRGLSEQEIMDFFQAEDRHYKTPLERCNSTQLLIIKRVLGLFFIDRIVRLASRYFLELFDFLSLEELVEVFSHEGYNLNAIRADNNLKQKWWQFLTESDDKLAKFLHLVVKQAKQEHHRIIAVFFESIVPEAESFQTLQLFLYTICNPLITLDDSARGKFRAQSELKEWIKLLPFAFLQKEKATQLVMGLLVYRKQRLSIADEHYHFFGIKGGYSKTQKMAVVDKLLRNIFAQTPDKQEPFTNEELAILRQGKLGSTIRKWEKPTMGKRGRNSIACFTSPPAPVDSGDDITKSSRYLY